MKKYIVIALSLMASGLMAQNVMAEAELEAENVNEVRVEGSFLDVYVVNGDRVFFEGIIEGNGDEGDYRFDADIIGSALVIKVIYTKDKYNWKNRKITKSRIDITLTDGVKLFVDNSSGDVSVANLRASEAKIEASSGDITLRSVVANLESRTSSGDIDIDGLIGDSKIRSTSGDQRLYDLRGTINSRSSSGDITVSKFKGDLKLEASSGDVDIRTGEGTVAVRTTSGEIEGRDIMLTGDAKFNASSGDVEIDFKNDLQELGFDLRASSGDLEVGSRSAEKRLIIERGRYMVVGETSSGDQEYD
ncbi:MAG: DUF4097 family beta strand repeat-containing protein [Bacteroidota bacterium]